MRDTVAQGGRGWYKPEGYAAFLAEAPMSSSVRDADASRYHARTWSPSHSGEPDPDRSWYKPRTRSEKPCIVSDRVVSVDVASETTLPFSIARRIYNALKSYLT